MIKRSLLAVCFLFAAVLLAARRPERYALVLEDPPIVRQIGARSELHSEAANAARRKILAAQAAVKQALAQRGLRVAGSVQTLANVVFVDAPPQEAHDLRTIPGVRTTVWMPRLKLLLNDAVTLVKAPGAWDIVGRQNAGAGVKIGIIDTGIDQTHPAFQDSSLAMPAGFPKCFNTASHNDCPFTNSKVIVARSYIDQLIQNDNGIPDDLSPRDRIGHGTAAAMVAAGVQNTGPANGGTTITGLAPKAYLGNYKVFGSSFNYGPKNVLIQALDDAFNDGMDIVTLNMGAQATYGPLDKGAACNDANPSNPCDIYAYTVENAAQKGMLVVVSAGNDGNSGVDSNGNTTFPTLNTINSPGTAPSAITVGASTNSHVWFASARVTGGPTIPAVFGDGPKPGGPMQPLVTRDVSALGNDGFACSGLNPGSLNNAIALIQRGNCSFPTKVINAQVAGALGVIIYLESGNNELFQPQGLAETAVPAVIIGNKDGQALKSFLASHSDATVVLDPSLASLNAVHDTVADFSSHGPSIGVSGLKPELVGVGTDLYTATESADPSGVLFDATGYTAVAGTSFSAPMVAGTLALVKSNNTRLTAAQLKSAVVNTATGDVTENGQPASVMAVGAGKLNAEGAVKTNVFADPATLSLGVVNTSTIGNRYTLKVTNNGPNTVSLSVQGDPLSITPTTVATGQTTNITVSFSGGVPGPGAYQGVILIKGGAVDLRVPYLYLVPEGIATTAFPIADGEFDGEVGQLTDLGYIGLKVIDRFGLPVPNVSIQFNPNNQIDRADPVTDIYGIAAANARLGPNPGEQQFLARASGSGQTITVPFNGIARVLPAPFTNGVVDAAMGQLGNGMAPGSWVSIYGVALSDSTRGFYTSYVPLSLAGVSVSFFGSNFAVPAPVSYVSPGQVNIQIPWELAGNNSARMFVNIGSIFSAAYIMSISDRLPAIFQYQDSSGLQVAAARHGITNALISSANPAKRGDILVVYCNGLGRVETTPPTGEPTPQQTIRVSVTPSVTIGGRPARVDFAGLSPGSIGLYQINVFVPDDAPSGIQPIIINSNGMLSKPANLAVQ